MIELRIVKNSINEDRIQIRTIKSDIKWVGETTVYGPREPIKLSMEKNWSEWRDLDIVYEDDLIADLDKESV